MQKVTIVNKYILQACLIFFLVVVGVGIVVEIDNQKQMNEEINDFKEDVESGNEINDGNLSDVQVRKEDTSNLISDVNSKVATVVVKALNGGLKFIINIVNGITN